MKNILLCVLVALLGTACGTTQGPFIGDRDHKEVTVTWVRVPPVMVGPFCEQKTGYRTEETTGLGLNSPKACATFGYNDKGEPICTIYSSAPESEYGLEVFGHEALHCFIGSWHN